MSKLLQKPSPNSSNPTSSTDLLWAVGLVSLILTRLLVPTEGTELGTTLWISCLTFAFACLRCLRIVRDPDWKRLQIHRIDVGVGLLIGGYFLATLFSMVQPADHRAALNWLFEWASLFVLWGLMRDLFRTISARQLLLTSLLTTGVALSGLGLWQHYVLYPSQSKSLIELNDLQVLSESGQPMTSAQIMRRKELLELHGDQLISLTGGARQAMLDRATQSVEPIGRFALTNSFASVLSATFLLLLGAILAQLAIKPRSFATVVLGASLLSVLACLLLTKCRTALFAFAVVGGAVFCWKLIKRTQHAQRVLKVAVIGLAGILLLTVIVISTGGLDAEVLSEAPKSLQYRLEYWQATLGIIGEHPIFGIGSGNFRQHYFKHKLPGSSEEILDPHQMVLDVWSQGGLLALTGLLLLIYQIGIKVYVKLRSPDEKSAENSNWTTDNSLYRSVSIVLGLAVAIVWVQQSLLEGFDELRLGIFGLIAVPTVCLLACCLPKTWNPQPFCIASLCVLGLHLMGAGGISMPAILGLLLSLIVVLVPFGEGSSIRPATATVLTLGMAGLLMLCIWSSFVPNLQAKMLIQDGRMVYQTFGNARSAENSLKKATLADSLNPDPWYQLASLQYQESRKQPRDLSILQAAIESLGQSIDRDPLGAKKILILADWKFEYALKTQTETDLDAAISTIADAIRQYPNYAPNWVMKARIQDHKLRGLGDGSASEAALREERDEAVLKALWLDDLNRHAQHSDKYLPDVDRLFLEDLKKGVSSRTENPQNTE